MKANKFLLLSVVTLLASSACSNTNSKKEPTLEPDNIIYEEVKPIGLNDMVEVALDDDEEVVGPSGCVLHYHNDDGGNQDRRFYVWNSVTKGVEYEYDSISSDGQDMQITLNFESDSRFKDFNLQSGFYFIIKVKGTWTGQSDDTYVDFSLFTPGDNNFITVWSIPGEGNSIDLYETEAETKMDKILNAVFDTDWKTIKVTSSDVPSSFSLYALTANYFKLETALQPSNKPSYLLLNGEKPTDATQNSDGTYTWNITLKYTIYINVQYSLEAIFPNYPNNTSKKIVAFNELYETERFTTYYNYSGSDLGVTVTGNDTDGYQTTFKVWSPTAARMRLLLYVSGTPSAFGGTDSYFASDMTYQPGGIWTSVLNDEYYGFYYNYFVYGPAGNFEVTDPYARACGINGARGEVVNFDETDPEGWDEVPEKWDGQSGYDIESANELSVYEVHVRDLTSHDTWTGESKKGTYSAFAESGTTYTQDGVTVKTGFDHIEELGIKAVQLLPVYDHDDNEVSESDEEVDIDYNWGYNPLNYNCIEGGYATDPYNGESRITEYKKMVMAYANNANHTRIIMDVVYNHVSSGPGSCFTKLMPKYYFRFTSNGAYYNGSGCGNEVKSEAPMMRKYIVESLCWWASEYKIKGFRFDLMGLLDCETLKQGAEALYKIDPDIVMYGEGWRGDGDSFHGSGTPAETANVYSNLYKTSNRVAVGAFNDTGRNALRGGNDQGWGSSTALPGWGYMQQGASDASSEQRSKVADMVWGIHTGKGGNPIQTINYASCHDNWTVYDQFYYTLGSGGVAPSTSIILNASTSAHALIMLSNGVAFMQGGEELFRTKEISSEQLPEVESSTYEKMYSRYVSHNSYNAPIEVNEFDWSRKISIDGISTTAYCQAFEIAIKLHTSMPKYAYQDGNFPYAKTSAGNKIDNISWAGSQKGSSKPQTYNGAAGFQLDEYFIFLAGRNWAWIQFGDVPSSTLVYSFGQYSYDNVNGTVNLGNYDNDTGGSIVVFYRGH